MGLRLIVGTEPALLFESSRETLRWSNANEARGAFARAEDALAQGYWIAGYLAYDGASAIGIFGPPSATGLPETMQNVEQSPLLPFMSREAYGAGVRALQSAIREGDVYQVNYSVPFALNTAGNPLELYARHARSSGARYQAYVEDGDLAILSWSPELFLSFEGGRLTARPMKGTASLDRVDDLRNVKNRAEHVMIVDLLRNDLHRICDDVEVEAFQTVERYPTYATMTSTITGTVRPHTPLGEIFEAMFPCGSVTGAPKRSAMRFIAQHEGRMRGVYCGSVGYLSPRRRGWWNVAIRTAQLDRVSGLGRYDAGGAIVADSRADDEWNEIAIKSRFLQCVVEDDSSNSAFALLETFADDADDATLRAHLARLERSAQVFGIAVDRREIEGFVRRRSKVRQLVRLRLGFGGSTMSRAAMEKLPELVRVCISSERVRRSDPFLRHKTSWRPKHNAAMREAEARDCFDALLCNERGELTEGSRTSLFFEADGALWTPPAACGVLPGILRERIIIEGRAHERAVTPDELRRAEAIYIGSSARGLRRAKLLS
jgi:para-aminobenzoate synthetase / 4-amino-4-deoxychorismate lyase